MDARSYAPASGCLCGAKCGADVGRAKSKLTAVEIKAAGVAILQDGGGLMLDKAGPVGKWIWRYSIAGRRRDMGLGAWPAVSLAQARQARDRWAAVLAEGRDPISERTRLLEAERAEIDRKDPTLEEAIGAAFDARKAILRGDGERGRWLSPLRVHVIPKIGKRRISSLHQTDLRDVMAPLWKGRTATAEKVFQRLRITFKHARHAGVDVDPSTVEAAQHMLGPLVRNITPTEATPWQDIPALFARLGEHPTASHLCLQWMILTVVRSDGCRGARMDEITGDVWTVPADRVKGRKNKVSPFRVPLSAAALKIVETCRPVASVSDGVLFPGHRGRPISNRATEVALDTLGEAGRPHGFRTSFRTWAQDTDAGGYDVAETALGHVVGGRVERSYARSDLLDRRRILMEKWARFVTGAEAQVIQLRA